MLYEVITRVSPVETRLLENPRPDLEQPLERRIEVVHEERVEHLGIEAAALP